MAEEGTGGRGRGEGGGKGRRGKGRGGKGRAPMTLWHGAPQCLNPALNAEALINYKCFRTVLALPCTVVSCECAF